MEIKLELNKDVNYNANVYFEKAKKLKSKLPGIEKTVNLTKKEIENFENDKQKYLERIEKQKKIANIKKNNWYEKFRWTFLSSEHLFVIGKDAGTNEVLVKKYLEETDIIMHSEAPGSPFGIIKNAMDKNGNLLLSKEILEEAASFLLVFSSQWKRGFGTADAFWVRKEQVSKKAESGEYMSKGSFMIRGDKNILKNIPLQICLGVKKVKIEISDVDKNDKSQEKEFIEYEELFSGSCKAVKKFADKNRFLKLEPGQLKYKVLNKNIKKILKTYIEDLPKYIPNECKILKK